MREQSHFTNNAGTAAKSLAASNSAKAIENADNHEYFAENNPAQS